MPLWHDPLDELIADLDRNLPSSTTTVDGHDRELIGCQLFVGALLYGTEEERARADGDPRVQAFLASMQRLAATSSQADAKRPDRDRNEIRRSQDRPNTNDNRT